jgi:uncharacterized SAM-binding protein YcdF (DUF218 family)
MEHKSKLRYRGTRFVIFILFMLLIWVFRVQLLRSAGNFLISEDELMPTQVLVVLGGNSLERGTAAVQLYRAGIAERIVCTGGNVPTALEAAGIPMFEAELSINFLLANGIDSSAVIPLTQSTSTFEEANEVLNWAAAHGVDEVTVLSSRFHTRRVRKVFKKAFKESEIRVRVVGAPSLNYNENEWWKSEEGLIMVNNEYMKTLYYLMKH